MKENKQSARLLHPVYILVFAVCWVPLSFAVALAQVSADDNMDIHAKESWLLKCAYLIIFLPFRLELMDDAGINGVLALCVATLEMVLNGLFWGTALAFAGKAAVRCASRKKPN
jgi:hypothetical protein